MKRNQRGVVFLPILIIILLVGAVGYFAYKNYQTKQSSKVSIPFIPSEEPVATTSPTPDPTAGWETHSDNEVGYSIKYPGDLYLVSKPGVWDDLYLSKEKAKEAEYCNNNSLGTLQNPCSRSVISFSVSKVTPAMFSLNHDSAKDYVEARLSRNESTFFSTASGVIFETVGGNEGNGTIGYDAYTSKDGQYYLVITRAAYMGEDYWKYLHTGDLPEYNSEEWIEFVQEFEGFSKKMLSTFEFTE